MRHISSSTEHRRGLTLIETGVATASTVVIFTLMAMTLGATKGDRLRSHSGWNLSQLAQGMYTYATDWEGRQWTKVPDEIGAYGGNIVEYNSEVRCLEPMYIGEDPSGNLWAWWTGGSLCESWIPGTTGYWRFSFDSVFQPYAIDSASLWEQNGSRSLFHHRGFREYVAGSVHDSVFYQPGTRDAFINGLIYDDEEEYFGPYVSKASGLEAIQYIGRTGYSMSAAAMWSPEVHRAPSTGGWQDPRSFDTGYRSPSIDQCQHPSLKTMFVEQWWIEGAPSRFHPDSMNPPAEPFRIEFFGNRRHWRFNQGHASAPMTAFYDGSIGSVRVGDAFDDDRIARKSTGDGLWSRDTPMGEDGYFGDRGNGDGFSSFHVLTIDGILGRDLLRRRDG